MGVRHAKIQFQAGIDDRAQEDLRALTIAMRGAAFTLL